MNKNWKITGYIFDFYDRFLVTKDDKKLEIVFKREEHSAEVYITSFSTNYFNEELTSELKIWIDEFVKNHNLDEIYSEIEIWKSKDEDVVGKVVEI